MEQKAKFIIIGLAGALVVFIFLFFQSFSSKQALVREKDDLQKENVSLSAKMDKLNSQLRSRQDEFDSLKKEIELIGRERNELQKRFILVNKEKEEALEKLKETQEPKRVTLAPPAAPAGQESYWAEILKAKAELEVQLSSLRQEFKAIKLNNEQLEKEKSNVELDLTSLKHDNDELKRQLDYNQQMMNNLAQEVVRERNDKIKIESTLKAIRNENTVLVRQIKTLNTQKVNLERKLQGLQDKSEDLERRYAGAEASLVASASRMENLKQQVEGALPQEAAAVPQAVAAPQPAATEPAPAAQDIGLSSSVELPPIVVRPQANAAVQARSGAALPAGRVISLNKENNFVIIDIGEEASVKVGDALRVYGKDDKPAADIEVIQTRKDISACDIKREYAPVCVGDIVK